MNSLLKKFVDIIFYEEFKLVKEEDGYALLDLQGANLGGIEGDRFSTPSQIIDRLEIYHNDYYWNDMEEEYGEGAPTTISGWLKKKQFLKEHPYHKDFLDVISTDPSVLDSKVSLADAVKEFGY